MLQKFSGIEKVHASEGTFTVFLESFVVSQFQKTSLRNNSLFQNFSGSEKFYGSGGR